MITADTILGSGPTFEHRAAAWGAAALSLDEQLAADVVRGLGPVIAALSTGVTHPLKTALAQAALSLRTEVSAGGAASLACPLLRYGGAVVHRSAGRQALYDALLLRSVAEGLCDELADALEVRSNDEGVLNYGSEVIVGALTDVALAHADATDAFAATDALIAVQREVAFSPRSLVERGVLTEVRPGDTLQSVARRVYGVSEDWTRLIADYNLQPPYLSAQARTGCLSPGVRLLRPGPSDFAAGDDGLGVSFRLTAGAVDGGQEWDLTPSPAGGIEMAHGLDALAVDCAVRLSTPLGDLGDSPNYGAPELPGMIATGANALSSMLAAETLLRDPRVADVVPRLTAGTSRSVGRVVGNVVVVPRG